MDFADGSMLDTTGGTCSMAGGSMASNWCKKKINRSKPQAMHKYHQISTGRFESMEDMLATICDRWIGAAEVVRDLLKRQCSDLQVAWLELHVNHC